MDVFGITADYDLNIMRPRQTLTTITADVLTNMEPILKECRPDIVLVHGDTTTSTAAALAAFYQQITVGHVEAGLRTFNIYSPFPEEMNRTITGRIATFHFSPTKLNESNLRREGVTKNIYVTGNTVIDAFQTTVKDNFEFTTPEIKDIGSYDGRLVLLTAHRRENLGEPLENICRAVKRLVEDFPDIKFVYPVHLNPRVRETVFSILGDLVLRTETERPEAVEAGTVKVVGVDEDDIYDAAVELLTNQDSYSKMAKAVNPYGDGHASERIAAIIIDNLGRKE